MPRKPSLPSSLEIHLLGPCRIAVDGATVEESRWLRRKAKLLVKLLALQPHHQLHREQLMELLWPELEPESAAGNLHTTIHAARRALEPKLKAVANSHFLLAKRQQVLLRAPRTLWIDAEAFARQATEAIKGIDTAAHEAALALYQGDLLIEDLYEDWTTAPRERLRTLRRDLILKLTRIYEKDGRYSLGIEHLKGLVAHDISDEQAHRRLMRFYASMGNKFQALEQYKQCREALRRELDANPEPQTVELGKEILHGRMQSFPKKSIEDDQEDVAVKLTDRPAMRLLEHDVIEDRSTRRGEAIDSLAVLPLTTAGADLNLEFLVEGLAAQIINRLSQVPRLRVMARNTVFRYKGREIDTQEAGRELNVRAVLVGRVLRIKDRLIITAELIDVEDGSQLWGEQYDRGSSDIFAVQAEIAREISDQIRKRVSPGHEKRLITHG